MPPMPRYFSPPLPPLKLGCSLQLLSPQRILGMPLPSYLRDQFWMLEDGAHCVDFP